MLRRSFLYNKLVNKRRATGSGWKLRAPLLVALIIATGSVFFFGRTAAAPCSPKPHHKRVEGITIIKSKPLSDTPQKADTSAKEIFKISELKLPPVHEGLSNSSEPQLRKL